MLPGRETKTADVPAARHALVKSDLVAGEPGQERQVELAHFRVLHCQLMEYAVVGLDRGRPANVRPSAGVVTQLVPRFPAFFRQHEQPLRPPARGAFGAWSDEGIAQQGGEVLCRDPADDVLLAAAVEGMADSIVTGDDDLLVLGDFEGIAIVTSRGFLDTITG